MPHNLDWIGRAPRTLTTRELDALLRVTGERVAGWRDHMLIAMAVGTGLREHELVALDLGDVLAADGTIRRRLQLRTFKRSNRDLDAQQVVLSKTLRTKLERYVARRVGHGALDPDAPLFLSRRNRRLSTRQVRTLFGQWQVHAGFERHVSFHALRHTACTNLYQATLDLRQVQRFARHRSILSSQRYTHASEDDLERAVDGLRC